MAPGWLRRVGPVAVLLAWQLAACLPAHAGSFDLKAVDSGTPMSGLWEIVRKPQDWAVDALRAPGADVPWQAQDAGAITLKADEALWLRFSVEPFGPLTPPRWVLELPKPGLDRVEMFRFEEDALTLQEVSGDRLSVAVWPISGRFAAFDIAPTRWTTVTYYFKISHAGALSLTGYLKSADHALRTQRIANLLFGGFFGSIGLMFMLSVAAAATTRRGSYAAFAVYAASTALCFVSVGGMLGEWWTEAPPALMNAAPFSLALTTAAFGLLYLMLAVSLRQLSRKRFFAILGVVALGLLAAVAPAFELPIGDLPMGYGVLAFGLTCAVLVFALLKGDSWSRLHLMSLLPYGLALSYPVAETVLGTRMVAETFAILAAASVLHLTLTYFALNAKVKVLREATMRLQASSTIDPLTGVANYRRLTMRVPGLMARARHHRRHGALMLVEVANLADFREVSGQRGQEMALVRAAEVIRSCVKNIDMVSRVDDAYFAVAIEAPTEVTDISAIATRLIAKGLQVASLPPHLTPLVFRVFIELVPKHAETLDDLLGGAVRKLRAVPRADPRRIFFGERDGRAR